MFPNDTALFVVPDSGVFGCHRCDWSGRAPELATLGDISIDRTDPRATAAQALALFDDASVIGTDDPCARYLFGVRGLDRPSDELLVDLRNARLLRHPTGHRGPALVALLRDVTGAPCAVQRTWLDHEGHKAGVQPQRASLGSTSGAAVRLSPAARTLALAEGVEDALAVTQLIGTPCWATLGTPGMRRVKLPRCVVDVVLVPDRDGAGVHAARELAYRLRNEGRRVSYRWPTAKDPAEEVRRGS